MPDDLSCDFAAFEKVARTRRSVRAFSPEPMPDAVIDRCLELALHAPCSHNLQPWRFVHVRDPGVSDALRHACLDQAPARSAATLVVAVACPDAWREMRRENLAHYRERSEAALVKKYRWMIPLLFEDGPRDVLVPLKALAVRVQGLFGPTFRGPFGRHARELWATKSTALACENFMLAVRAAGWDSCALEGFDEVRVKRLLQLPDSARVVMVLALGRRDPRGVSEQVRFDPRRFVTRI